MVMVAQMVINDGNVQVFFGIIGEMAGLLSVFDDDLDIDRGVIP